MRDCCKDSKEMKNVWDQLYIPQKERIGKYLCLNEECKHTWEESALGMRTPCPKCRGIYIKCTNIKELFGTKKSRFR